MLCFIMKDKMHKYMVQHSHHPTNNTVNTVKMTEQLTLLENSLLRKQQVDIHMTLRCHVQPDRNVITVQALREVSPVPQDSCIVILLAPWGGTGLQPHLTSGVSSGHPSSAGPTSVWLPLPCY